MMCGDDAIKQAMCIAQGRLAREDACLWQETLAAALELATTYV